MKVALVVPEVVQPLTQVILTLTEHEASVIRYGLFMYKRARPHEIDYPEAVAAQPVAWGLFYSLDSSGVKAL